MTRRVEVSAHGAVARDVVVQLQAELSDRRTLGDVLAWARAQTPPRVVTEIVTQDEYTHDVVIQHDTAVYLVFDTT